MFSCPTDEKATNGLDKMIRAKIIEGKTIDLLINGSFAFCVKISKDKIIDDKMILKLFCR
jgi:hypothetical protein